jgi:hypothetical protein
MDDAPRRNRSALAPLVHPLRAALHLWWRTWRAALAAEEAHVTKRAQGAPRKVAADAAFKALTGEERPAFTSDARQPLPHPRVRPRQEVPPASPPIAPSSTA